MGPGLSPRLGPLHPVGPAEPREGLPLGTRRGTAVYYGLHLLYLFIAFDQFGLWYEHIVCRKLWCFPARGSAQNSRDP